jgi:hypothetical protein
VGDCQIRGPGLEVLIDVRKAENVIADSLMALLKAERWIEKIFAISRKAFCFYLVFWSGGW